MLPTILQDRFDQLLAFAKDANFRTVAHENLAAHLPDVHDCANGRMHDASKNLVTKMPSGYIA